MVTKRIICLILTGIFLSSSCEDFPYDKKALTYKNKFVFDNQFRMDGMYLSKIEYGYYLHYFFQNGSYYAEGISDKIEPTCYQINSKAREIPYAWGYFIIEDTILKVQTYEANRSNNYNFKFRVRERWAEIVNDTTLHFYKAIDPDRKERVLDELFHFRYCSNKPDSTNILMRD